MRQIRAGNLHYIGRPGEKDWDWVHDPWVCLVGDVLFSQWKIHHDWIHLVNIFGIFWAPRISKSKDPKNDHGPETLFDLAMEAVANHPRVHEWVGTKVLPKAEPDKAVYRMHEGWVVQ